MTSTRPSGPLTAAAVFDRFLRVPGKHRALVPLQLYDEQRRLLGA
jgi:hypothetical protein